MTPSADKEVAAAAAAFSASAEVVELLNLVSEVLNGLLHRCCAHSIGVRHLPISRARVYVDARRFVGLAQVSVCAHAWRRPTR